MLFLEQSASGDEVTAELVATSPITSGKMFGMPCLKTNGKAFARYYQRAMVCKIQERNGSVRNAVVELRSLVVGWGEVERSQRDVYNADIEDRAGIAQ